MLMYIFLITYLTARFTCEPLHLRNEFCTFELGSGQCWRLISEELGKQAVQNCSAEVAGSQLSDRQAFIIR